MILICCITDKSLQLRYNNILFENLQAFFEKMLNFFVIRENSRMALLTLGQSRGNIFFDIITLKGGYNRGKKII